MNLLIVLCIVTSLVTRVSSVQFNWWSGDENKCGVEASTNIIHHNPWLVDIEYWRRDNPVEIVCAATLISKRHLTTAAHCVRNSRYTRLVARLGEYDKNSEVDCVDGVCADPVVSIDVVDVTIHPGYDGKENDIAILTLAHDAPYTDFIRPICLPNGDLESDTTFFAAGWGKIPTQGIYSHEKKIIPLPLWTREKCEVAYKEFVLAQNVICAGGEEGYDTCMGDSGGPLTWVRDVVELRGVTKGGYSLCGTKGYPGIYTSVVDYLDWIQTVIDASEK